MSMFTHYKIEVCHSGENFEVKYGSDLASY